VDLFGHCRPSAVLGLLQEAATQAVLALGVSGPEALEKYHCLWMVARTWVQLDRPLRWNQQVDIKTWHRGGVGASTYRDFDLSLEGKPVGRGVSSWVLVDADSHKLFRLKNVAELQGTDGGALNRTEKLHRVAMPDTFDSRSPRAMAYSDTDINGHVNNIHYADFACDALHLERMDRAQYVREFHIGYVGECRAGETIQIDTAARGGQRFARGTGEDGGERFDFSLDLGALR
jgi:acyl-ACP thioesterase